MGTMGMDGNLEPFLKGLYVYLASVMSSEEANVLNDFYKGLSEPHCQETSITAFWLVFCC